MTKEINLDAVPVIAAGYRLQFEEAQDSWVLLYPEGMVTLNQSASEILKRCDGKRDINQIVEVLEKDFEQTGLVGDVTAFMEIALENKWIKLGNG